MYICISLSLYTYIYIYIRTIYIYIYTYMRMYIYIYIYTYNMYVCVYIYIYIYIYICAPGSVSLSTGRTEETLLCKHVSEMNPSGYGPRHCIVHINMILMMLSSDGGTAR